MRTGSEIRETFLRFFEGKGHRRVPSSSLVPANDPTLLFTNAGMNQFKDVFLGLEKRAYNRAASSQKCVRAGGKHNDLENVGFTRRHHTFFEMLGNFSFGDYFKREAIAYAWELITSKEWFGISPGKIYCTIFQGEQGIPRDDEAEKFWLQAGVPRERIFALGMQDNFWSMADVGPCGPCSEVHYDLGADASDAGHAHCEFPCDCGRYVEFWNLVFMQFDRDAQGTYHPLPKPSVDTGMGLERIASILQGQLSNYDTDLFTPLLTRAAELTGSDLKKELAEEQSSRAAASLRVIADHARACAFLVADGVLPANDGRGYVLRKILRRAIRHGRLLGATRPFMGAMVEATGERMKDAYPELAAAVPRVTKIVEEEERRFARTLDLGLQRLEEDFREIVRQPPGRYAGEKAFRLYDTFGLPFDFILEAARDAGIALDAEGFERAMGEQRERARASWKGGAKSSASPAYAGLHPTVFEGYRQAESSGCEVLAILKDGQGVPALHAGELGEIVLDRTPFYADSGGQVGDTGVFLHHGEGMLLAEISGCVMPVRGVRAHQAVARAEIQVGMRVDAAVHAGVRQATMRNHTATHLLHAGLREVLGEHVKQAGSLVDPGHLRFDFSHFTGVAAEELQDIEDLVNRQVLKNAKVEVLEDVPIDVAVNEFKAMALFGEKYGERVRVVRIGDFSTELCGGTHTGATGEIGLIKILHEGSVSSGVRRVEAITGEGSLRRFRQDYQLEHVVASLAPGGQQAGLPAEALRQELDRRDAEIRKLQRELEQLRMKSASSSLASVNEQVKDVHGVKVLAHRVDNLERGQMRTLVDNLRDKLGSGVVVLGGTQEGKVSLIAGVTKDLTSRVQAGKIISAVAQKVGGSGGGRPDLAEAGGKDPAALDAALADAYAVVDALLR